MVTKQLNDYMTGMAAPKKTNIKVKRHKLNKPKKNCSLKVFPALLWSNTFIVKKKGQMTGSHKWNLFRWFVLTV